MKIVSQAFKDAQASPNPKPVVRVYYKRRFWNPTTRTYGWEASWTEVPQNQLVQVSAVTGKLDTDRLNEFKLSNVTIMLLNDTNQWGPWNSTGRFGPDAGSRDGYEPYWTKFQVRAGFVLSDGTESLVAMFTGLLVDIQTDSVNRTAQATVTGLESLLANASAELVSTLVTEETIGTGNGTNKDFTTAQPGVGIVQEVSVNGIANKAGIDYSVAQINERLLGAKISFTNAPANGTTVRATYRYWKQNQKVEDLVKDLLTAAGIASPAQVVDPVLFPTGVSKTIVQDTQSDWLAGTGTDVDMTSSPGDIKIQPDNAAFKVLLDDFSDGNFTSNPTWTEQFSGIFSVSGGRLAVTGSGGSNLYTSSTKVIGTWQWDLQFANAVDGVKDATVAFISTGVGADFENAYAVQWFKNAGGDQHKFQLFKQQGSTRTVIASVNKTLDTASHTVRVSRAANGRMKVYFDGVLTLDTTDTQFSVSAIIGVHLSGGISGQTAYLDNIYVPTETIAASHISQAIDLSAALQTIGRLDQTHSLNGGTITYYSRTSADAVTWDPWTGLGSSGQINSTVRRYLQIKSDFSISTSANNDPTVHSYLVNYKTASTVIALANFTDRSVYDAIQDLGKFANYEWGFKEDETFFFRSKQVSRDVDVTIRHDTQIVEITSLSMGFDQVYSEVEATYGDFSARLTAKSDQKNSPAARFAKKRLTIDGGDLLIAPDTDVATGIAALYFADYAGPKLPRRRFKVRTKLIPWADLSDTADVTLDNNLPVRPWYIGDTTVYLGQADIHLYGGDQQLAHNMICKIVGYRHDIENRMSEFDMEGIIQ